MGLWYSVAAHAEAVSLDRGWVGEEVVAVEAEWAVAVGMVEAV